MQAPRQCHAVNFDVHGELLMLSAGCVVSGLVNAGEECSNPPVLHTSIFQFGSECPNSTVTLILAWDAIAELSTRL
jgi:hypothetical protein